MNFENSFQQSNQVYVKGLFDALSKRIIASSRKTLSNRVIALSCKAFSMRVIALSCKALIALSHIGRSQLAIQNILLTSTCMST